jgi:hypothetical protein
MYGIFGRKFTDYTVIHSVYTRFWSTLTVSRARRAGLDWCVQCQVFLQHHHMRVYALCINTYNALAWRQTKRDPAGMRALWHVPIQRPRLD